MLNLNQSIDNSETICFRDIVPVQKNLHMMFLPSKDPFTLKHIF